jgi:type II secretory pathway component PulF
MSQTSPLHESPIAYASLRDFDTNSFARRMRRLLVRQLVSVAIGVALLVAFVGLFSLFYLGPLSAVMGLLACFLFTAIAAGCLRSARRQRAMLALSYCEQGARLHAPLPDFLRAVAMNESRSISRRLIAIAETLEATAPLGSAIASELPELPPRVGELLRAAEWNGTLQPTLARLMRDEEPLDADQASRGPMSGAYLAITMLALALPANLILIFVVPKLTMIFRDFGVGMPSVWARVMSLDPITGLVIGIVMIVLTLAIVIGTLANNARWIFYRRRAYDRPLKGIVDRVLWYTPLIGSEIRDRDWSDVCQGLADGLDQHRPLDIVLRETAAADHLNGVTATRIDAWLMGVARGERLSTAARSAFVPQVICGMIGANAVSSDSLAPAFAFLARYYRGRALRRGAWLSAAAIPTMTLACGAIVAAFALSLWVPLARLIDLSNPYRMGL